MQRLVDNSKAAPGASLHTRSLAHVYDPDLEDPDKGERTPRIDHAIRRASLSFYTDMSDMRCFPGPCQITNLHSTDPFMHQQNCFGYHTLASLQVTVCC